MSESQLSMQASSASFARAARAQTALGRREGMLELFRSAPKLALELLSRLPVSIPEYRELRLDPARLERCGSSGSDAVVLVLHGNQPSLGIIIDARVESETDTRYSWPLQACALRAHLRCPVALCVVTPRRSVARWAARPIRLGAGNHFAPIVLGPASVPAVTDLARAKQLPELAVLSTIVHGRGLDQERAARIAAAALQACGLLELRRCQTYTELVRSALGEPARKLLLEMELEQQADNDLKP